MVEVWESLYYGSLQSLGKRLFGPRRLLSEGQKRRRWRWNRLTEKRTKTGMKVTDTFAGEDRRPKMDTNVRRRRRRKRRMQELTLIQLSPQSAERGSVTQAKALH